MGQIASSCCGSSRISHAEKNTDRPAAASRAANRRAVSFTALVDVESLAVAIYALPVLAALL